jgi:peptidoglycan/LPS O-acetylase OafA/YrhL
MVQRIQSIYLFLTTFLPLLFLKGRFLSFIDNAGSTIYITFNRIYRATDDEIFSFTEKVWPQSVIIILISLLSLVAIVLFRNRRLQMRITLSVIALSACLIVSSFFYSMYIINSYGASIVPGIKMIIPFLILILAILAYRGIRKDERLVRSYDRLR